MSEEQYQTPEWVEILKELVEKAKKNNKKSSNFSS